MKIGVSLMLALIGLTNWTSIFAKPFDSYPAIASLSKNAYAYSPVPNSDRAPAARVEADASKQAQAAEAYGKLPVRFEANNGQTDPKVKFFSRGTQYALFLTSTESVILLDEPDAVAPKSKRRRASLRMKMEGANPTPQIEGLDEQPGKTNYFIGNDPGRWRTNIASYSKVKYTGVYPDIDLLYYGNQGKIEFDFMVAAGADYKKIGLLIEGAKQVRIDTNGDLVLTATLGEIRQHKPFVYQEENGEKREISARYVFKGKREVGFEIGQYDRTRPLIIDPVLDYATFLGGTNDDEGRGIRVDGSGNAYIIGRTFSFNFPVTIDAFDTTYANSFDVTVTKLNASGSNIIYSTYVGGNSDDSGFGISIDSSGNAYITGLTSSNDYPTTAGAFQSIFPGSGDGFVTKLNTTGTALVYSTYLGGSSSDQSFAIAVDSSANAYVTGVTNSTNFPITPGAFQSALSAGFSNDTFVTKLNSAGTALLYSTYLGGTNNERGSGIAVDSSGRAFITGSTSSADFDVTPGAFQTIFGGSDSPFGTSDDAYVTQLNGTGTALVYSTYIGSLGDEDGLGIAVNSSGEAFITGNTSSFNYPTTAGVVRVINGGAAKTTNAASSWAAINSGITDNTILSFAVDPTTPAVPSIVYTGTNEDGIFKSTNGGGSWTAINSGLTNLTIKSIAVDPVTPATVYLGTNGRGVFKSTDSGASWRGVNTGQGGSSVNSLVINPANAATIYAGTNSGVFKSTNGGANWAAINTGFDGNPFIHMLTIDPANPSNLYAGTFSGIFFTRNAGQNWTESSLSSGTIRTLQIDPLAPANVYGGGDGGAFKSTDSGVTWRGINTGLTNRTVNALAINPASPNVIYAGTGNGIFKSTDGGSQWSSASTGLAGSVVNTLAVDPAVPATIYAGTAFGAIDGFVTRLNAAGTGLVYSTFLGGSNNDISNGIAVDSANNAYLAGQTDSNNFPVTPITFSILATTFSTDAFVTKLNPTGAGLVYSSYLGGSNTDQAFAISVNSSGNAFVTGTTNSSTTNSVGFPVTPGAYQTVLGGVPNSFSDDSFIAKFNSAPSLSADLTLELAGPSGTIQPSSSISYTITVTNDGPDPAFGILITDELAPFINFNFCNLSSGSGSNSCTGLGSTVTFSVTMLAPGQSITATVFGFPSCLMPNGVTLPNTATVTALTPDPNTANNADMVSNTGINPPPTLVSSSQSFGPGGGTSSAFVSSNTNCAWTAVSNDSWITINFSTGCCNGSVNYTVAPNPGRPRIGTLTIAGNTFTVFQSGAMVSTTIGAYLPSSQTFFLRNSNTAGFADLTIQYGPPGAIAIVGDWDGNLTTTLGAYQPSSRTFFLRNSNTAGFADIATAFGPAGATPLAGDWNGDGTTTIGAYDPATRTFYLRNSNSPGDADITIQFGPSGAIPIAGDWDGNGTTTIGAYDPSDQTFYLRNSNTAGFADLTIKYGPPGARPVMGDWDGNGTVTLGAYDPANQTFYLRNTNSLGFADLTIQYGPPGATPLAGDWDGQ